MNGFDPRMFLQMIQQGQNPEQLMMNFIQQRMGNSPMGQNLMSMVQNRDSSGIENFVRNYYKQQGRDFDKEFGAFKKNLGL